MLGTRTAGRVFRDKQIEYMSMDRLDLLRASSTGWQREKNYH